MTQSHNKPAFFVGGFTTFFLLLILYFYRSLTDFDTDFDCYGYI